MLLSSRVAEPSGYSVRGTSSLRIENSIAATYRQVDGLLPPVADMVEVNPARTCATRRATSIRTPSIGRRRSPTRPRTPSGRRSCAHRRTSPPEGSPGGHGAARRARRPAPYGGRSPSGVGRPPGCTAAAPCRNRRPGGRSTTPAKPSIGAPAHPRPAANGGGVPCVIARPSQAGVAGEARAAPRQFRCCSRAQGRVSRGGPRDYRNGPCPSARGPRLRGGISGYDLTEPGGCRDDRHRGAAPAGQAPGTAGSRGTAGRAYGRSFPACRQAVSMSLPRGLPVPVVM